MERIKPQEIDPSSVAMALGIALLLLVVLAGTIVLFSLERAS